VKDHIDKEKNIKVVIIGNKIDLKGERKISEEEGKKIAKEYNLDYFETSAKDNIGINEAMIKIINDILNDRLKEKDENINNKIKLEDKKTEENENGCSC